MAPVIQSTTGIEKWSVVALAAVDVAWLNQATWRPCRFGPKPAPRHRGFGPEKEGVS